MSWHLFGIVATRVGVASNNRGETEGNIATLQKILWNGEVHTTVSAEALRWAIRYYWQTHGHENDLNRTWDDASMSNKWDDPKFEYAQAPGAKLKLDDDVLGFMMAEAAMVEAGNGTEQRGDDVLEGEREEADSGTEQRRSARRRRGKKQRGTIRQRRSRLELTRAISMTPFSGDLVFNAASRAATPSASRTGTDPVPYGVEVHSTRFQYGFALTPGDLYRPERALLVLDAIYHLGEVAGNHARFLFDFSPDAIVLRWTHDPAPRILYALSWDGNAASVRCPGVLAALSAGDVQGDELIAGGALNPEDARILRDYKAFVDDGVGRAICEAKERLRKDLLQGVRSGGDGK